MTGVVTNFIPNALARASQINDAFALCYPAANVSSFTDGLLPKSTAPLWRAGIGAVGAPAAANDNEVALFDSGAAAVKSSGTLWSSVARVNISQTWSGTQNFTGAVVTVADQLVGVGDSNAANTKYVNDFFNAYFITVIAPTNNPVFTGNPRGPTPATNENDTSLATTAFVKSVLGNFAGFTFVSATTTLTAADHGKAIHAASGTPFTITLPVGGAWGGVPGPVMRVINYGTAAVTISRQGSDFIYCAPAGLGSSNPSIVLTPGQDVLLINRGNTEWDVWGGSWLIANTQCVPSTAITGLGTAATKNVGTAANNVVQLDGSARLPAVDGSQLTGVAATWAPGSLYGLTLSRSGVATIGIAAGSCRNEDSGTAFNMTMVSPITKTLSAWAAGTGNGGLDTGTIAASTWYHVHLIRKTSDGSIDALLSLSATAPTMPSGYVARRRLGSIRTDGSSQVIAFVQQGAKFTWDVPVVDVSANGPGTAAVTRTLTVPTSVIVEADIIISVMQQSGVVPAAWVSPLANTDTAPGGATSNPLDGPFQATSLTAGGYWTSAPSRVVTNTSAQVRSRLSASGASVRFGIVTLGWIDGRGAQ